MYLPPELQIAPPKKASTVGGGGVGSGLIKVSALKSFSGTSTRGKGGRRGRPPKQDVSSRSFALKIITTRGRQWLPTCVLTFEYLF